MACKAALQDADGDMERATEILREKGLASAAKRAGRSANQGLVDSYIHFNNTVGVLVEVNCETDFVANTDEFKTLVKDIALHIASPASPSWVTREDVPGSLLDSRATHLRGAGQGVRQARRRGREDRRPASSSPSTRITSCSTSRS